MFRSQIRLGSNSCECFPDVCRSCCVARIGDVLAMDSKTIAMSSVDDLLWARMIFTLGAVVTAATTVMIVRGHLYWRHREPNDVR